MGYRRHNCIFWTLKPYSKLYLFAAMEWARADEISLSDADMAEIEAVLPVGFAHGDRYSYHHMRTIERYC